MPTEDGSTEKNYCRILHKRSGSSYTYEIKIYADGTEANNIEEARQLTHKTLKKMILQEEGGI